MPILPEPNDRPKLSITPEGVEIYHALRRGKEFVTLHYRKDKPVLLATVQEWIGAVLNDIAQADLLLRGSVTVELFPQGIDIPTLGNQFTGSLKVEVITQTQEDAAWVAGLRAQFARKSG